jgi:hypothetical protein
MPVVNTIASPSLNIVAIFAADDPSWLEPSCTRKAQNERVFTNQRRRRPCPGFQS